MEFISLNKAEGGRYVHRYDLLYRTASGAEKRYEIISRQAELDGWQELAQHPADAVVLMLQDESGEHLLLQREFRMATGQAVYNFPAGLIDPGEDARQAAERELREETGLRLTRIDRILPDCFNAVGFSNETNIHILGRAEGCFAPSGFEVEEIEPRWVSRSELLQLLETEVFEARTQAFCLMWALRGEF